VLAQPPTGGDQNGFANLVERDAVPRGERLNGGDARDDVVIDVDPGRDRIEDAASRVRLNPRSRTRFTPRDANN